MVSENVPPFDSDGLLPGGEYELTLEELLVSPLVRGSHSPSWNIEWRVQLVENLAIMVKQLWKVGIRDIYINGSFVEDKDHPNDIDGYFQCDLKYFVSGQLEEDLNRLDPHQVWAWDPTKRHPYPGYPKKQLPMWHVYRVELYPHYGQFSGILDEWGNELEFPSAFRRSRSLGRPKGIVKVKEQP